jgi:hypothetical protein
LKIFSNWGYKFPVFDNLLVGHVVNIVKKAALRIARGKYCKAAIDEQADLSALREKPARQVIVGLFLIAFSYVIGLPAVVFLGVCAVKFQKPMIAALGGPLIYGVSTIIFLVGIKMAGKKYVQVFCRWVVRVVLEKILGDDLLVRSEGDSGEALP